VDLQLGLLLHQGGLKRGRIEVALVSSHVEDGVVRHVILGQRDCSAAEVSPERGRIGDRDGPRGSIRTSIQRPSDDVQPFAPTYLHHAAGRRSST
jgi:hypothetical protein